MEMTTVSECKYKYSLTIKTPIQGINYSSIGATVSVEGDDAQKTHKETLEKAFALLIDAHDKMAQEDEEEEDEEVNL